VDGTHRWVLAVLDLLAADPDRQRDWLRGHGVSADQLVLLFDDALLGAAALGGAPAARLVGTLAGVADAVAALGHHDCPVWTDAALDRGDWHAVRTAARRARDRWHHWGRTGPVPAQRAE
jgi:hypothetical protein